MKPPKLDSPTVQGKRPQESKSIYLAHFLIVKFVLCRKCWPRYRQSPFETIFHFVCVWICNVWVYFVTRTATLASELERSKRPLLLQQIHQILQWLPGRLQLARHLSFLRKVQTKFQFFNINLSKNVHLLISNPCSHC
jgi:hypothetical protein